MLALSVAAFGGMVRDAVTNGEVAASWQVVGADATVTPSPVAASFTIPAAAARAIAGVPVVTHAARVYQAIWISASGTRVIGARRRPGRLRGARGRDRGVPGGAGRAARARPPRPGAPQPVLASPSAAAALGNGPVTVSTQDPVRPVSVRVAGTLASTPALPGMPALPGTPALPSAPALPANNAFILMPLAAMKSSATPPTAIAVNEMLLTGSGIDRARLTAVVGQEKYLCPAACVTFRSRRARRAERGAAAARGGLRVITLSRSIAAAGPRGWRSCCLSSRSAAPPSAARPSPRLATMGLGEGSGPGSWHLSCCPR